LSCNFFAKKYVKTMVSEKISNENVRIASKLGPARDMGMAYARYIRGG